MTPERLADIRERANLQCGLDGDDADDLLIHVDHLTAENARLRAGIEALASEWEEREAYACHNAHECVRCLAYQSATIRVRALLNPPIEGRGR